MSYHQGITWPWLAGLYIDAFKNLIKNEKDKEIKKSLEKDFDTKTKNKLVEYLEKNNYVCKTK